MVKLLLDTKSARFVCVCGCLLPVIEIVTMYTATLIQPIRIDVDRFFWCNCCCGWCRCSGCNSWIEVNIEFTWAVCESHTFDGNFFSLIFLGFSVRFLWKSQTICDNLANIRVQSLTISHWNSFTLTLCGHFTEDETIRKTVDQLQFTIWIKGLFTSRIICMGCLPPFTQYDVSFYSRFDNDASRWVDVIFTIAWVAFDERPGLMNARDWWAPLMVNLLHLQ